MTDNNKEEFTRLITPLMPRLERFALSISFNRHEAADICGETLLKAWEGYGRLQNKKAMLSYLFTIASRVRAEFINKKKSGPGISDIGPDELRSPSAMPDMATDLALMREALSRMENKMAEALSLHYLIGFNQKEIADIQGCSLAAVKLRMFRGRKKLASMLGAEDDLDKINNHSQEGGAA